MCMYTLSSKIKFNLVTFKKILSYTQIEFSFKNLKMRIFRNLLLDCLKWLSG